MNRKETEIRHGVELQNGKYTIVKSLGQGSFGITYLATTKLTMRGTLGQLETTANVAIKEFFMRETNCRANDGCTVEGSSGSLFINYRQKFRQEAEHLSQLSHPNIVSVLDIFDENNTTYYVMQYLDGLNLDEYIEQQGRISEKVAITIMKDIGSAVQYMHSKKMLHLDLKPKNVMLNHEGKVFLIDFGLSKQYDSKGEPESSTKVGAGTPGYAPIEQANYQKGKKFPVTMDVYALGATMFKMLTGVRPPEASIILNEGFPLYEFQNRNINSHLLSCIAKAMAPAQKDRCQSVAEFLNLLKENDSTRVNPSSQVHTDLKANSPQEDFGYYTTIVGAGYGSEVIRVKVRDPLRKPDGIVQLSYRNPQPGTLSYDFTLNDNGRNHVVVYRGKKVLLDEYWRGGLSEDFLDALKQNGFFSRVHWERESSTTPLNGSSVSCAFYYQNGELYVRDVKFANPFYHHVLLDAVQNVVQIGELSQWLYKALDREHAYTQEDIERYGISILSFGYDGRTTIYYRGRTYRDEFHMLQQTNTFEAVGKVFGQLPMNLTLISDEQESFHDYLRRNSELLSECFNIVTFCNDSDYIRIAEYKRTYPMMQKWRRIVCESHLLPLCFNHYSETVTRYEYQGLFCEAEAAEGVVEIIRSGRITDSGQTGSFKMGNHEGFLRWLIGGGVLNSMLSYKWGNGILLSCLTFSITTDIWLGSVFRDRIMLVKPMTTYPAQESRMIYEGDCRMVISFCNHQYELRPQDLFGYIPQSFDFQADIDANLCITFELHDEEKKQIVRIPMSDLLNYEVKK